MKVVYASTTAVVGQTLIVAGTHWPAEDPVVLDNPSLFSDDPRYGLMFSSEPEELRDSLRDDSGGIEIKKRAYVRRS